MHGTTRANTRTAKTTEHSSTTYHVPMASSMQVCGPPPMMDSVSGDKAPDKSQGELKGMLADLGYSADQVFKF